MFHFFGAFLGGVQRFLGSVGASADRVLFPRLAALQPSRTASRPSVRPLARLLRAFALRRGDAAPHTRRAVPTSRGGTPRPAMLSPRLCSRVPSTLCDESVPPGDGLLSSSVSLRTTQGEETEEPLFFIPLLLFGCRLQRQPVFQPQFP